MLNRRRRALTAAAATILTVGLGAVPAQSASAAPAYHKGTPPLSTPWTAEVGPDNALPEYPRPQLTRDAWQNLNGVWQFAGAQDGQAPPVGQNLGERVLVPYPIESALSGIQRHEDRMWYRRTFTVPAAWTGKRLQLHFGAVDYDAKVWVNGVQVATHRGGYDGFDVDVTNALRGNGPQELIVWAEDLTDATGQPIGKQRRVSDRGIFYQGSSGIWRTVWMEPVATSSISSLNTTPDVAAGALKLTANTVNGAGLTVRAVARNASGGIVGQVTGAADAPLTLPVRNPKLWSPDSPYLYGLEVTLLDGSTAVDSVGSYFGLREIGMRRGADGKLRIALNGEILFNMATLDQGFWPDGLNTAPTDAGLRFDLEQHKVMGFNAVRKHIEVEPDRWYYWADRLGLMVWQDMPAANTGPIPAEWRAQFESELHEMVREHRSWTSIVAWVPFNEGWGEWDRTETGRIADEVKAQDPSRLVNAHSGVNCCNSKGDSGRGDVVDFHEYNNGGPASPAPDERRVSIDGEHGGYGLKVPNHMWFGDGQAYQMLPDSAALTRAYVQNQQKVLTAANSCGISAAVYTQITDVEAELNGFFTYDRQVAKMDLDRVRAINRKIIREATGAAGSVPQPPAGTPGATGVAAYPLDGSTEDVAGDHDATLVGGPAYVDAHTGQGVDLNGANQFIDTGAPVLDTASDYSAAAWVKLDKVDGAFQTVISQDGPASSDFFLQYSGADQRFAMSFVGVRALASFRPEPGRWYHLVGVRDSVKGELRLYVDGQLAGSIGACLPQAAPTGNTVIGRGRFGGNPVDYLDGTVDQVHLYDRALTPAEITALYDSGQ